MKALDAIVQGFHPCEYCSFLIYILKSTLLLLRASIIYFRLEVHVICLRLTSLNSDSAIFVVSE